MNGSNLPIRIGIWVVVLVVIAGLYFWRMNERRPPVSPVETPAANSLLDEKPIPVEPFTLTDTAGEAFDSKELEGKVWVASFFFSSCPGPCLNLNRRIAGLRDKVPSEVRFVSISVDPENDTPEKLAAYAQSFRNSPDGWRFLTGDRDNIHQIAANFKVTAGEKAGGEHSITHTFRLMLVDQQGNIRGYYSGMDDADLAALHKKIEKLLQPSSS